MDTRDLAIEGVQLKVAPTPLGKMARAQQIFATHGMESEAGTEAMIEALFWGIRRARKEHEPSGAITLEWLQENVDAKNAKAVFAVFRDVNLLVATEAGQGEVVASVP